MSVKLDLLKVPVVNHTDLSWKTGNRMAQYNASSEADKYTSCTAYNGIFSLN